MFWSILHRTILWELIRVFGLSLLGITGMLLMAGIVAEASKNGLSPAQIMAAIPLLIPSTLPYTIPATTLFATCVVYGRLAHDNEILAIKAAGINILSIVCPSIFLGLAMTVLTMVLYLDVIPTTHFMIRAMVMQDIEEFLYTIVKREHVINIPGSDYRMAVKRVEGRILIDAIFEKLDKKTRATEVTARAEEAEMHVDLRNKQIIIKMRHCNVASRENATNGYFLEKDWPVDLPPDFDKSNKKNKAGDMSWEELLEYRDDLTKQKEKIDAQIAMEISLMAVPNPDPNRREHVGHLRNASRQKLQDILTASTEMLMRPALAFGCLCFVMVGCPIGIWFSKSDYLSAFITCFLPIVFLYYPLLLCGINLSKDINARFHPLAAVWCANAIMAVVAVPLYRKLLKN